MNHRARAIALYLFAALCPPAICARALTILNTTTAISVTVAYDGTYTIEYADPAWTFSGAVLGGVSNIRTIKGTDAAGDFQAIAFDERERSGRHLEIRTWSGRPGVLFTQTI